MMDCLNIILTALDRISTVVIAIFTTVTFFHYRAINKRDDEYKQQTTDLYKAIVIATIIQKEPDQFGIGVRIDQFKKLYDGKTPIFKEKSSASSSEPSA